MVSAPAASCTSVERTSDRDLIVTRTFDAPPHIVFAAWTTPDLFMRWWAPRSSGVFMLACDMDVRVGGRYRVAFGHDAANAMEFFGKYLEVVAPARLVWTNEEEADAPVTMVTFEDQDGRTLLVLHELYPSKEALDEAMAGMEGCTPEQFAQLDDLLVDIVANMGGG